MNAAGARLSTRPGWSSRRRARRAPRGSARLGARRSGRRGKALKKVYPMVSGSGGVMDHTDPSLRSWDLTRIVLGVTTIGGLTLASFWVLRPFLLAAIWATMIVVSTWTLRAVEARVWGKRSLAVTIMTFAMLLVIAA